MARYSDTTADAARVAQEQAYRLRLLRELSGLTVTEAAKRGHVTRFSWSRMERGQNRIDPVALCYFILSNKDLCADYVITGNLAGLRGDLARDLIQREQQDAAKQAAGSESASSLSPFRKIRAEHTESSDTLPDERPEERLAHVD